MVVTATELRANIYTLMDQVLTTGEALEVKRHGKKLRLIRDTQKSKLSALQAHPDTIQCTEEELIYNNWVGEWKHGLS